MTDYKDIVRRNIKRLRKERKISQMKLAMDAGITSRSLGKLERGEGESYHSTVIKCAEALDVHPMLLYFFGGVSNALPFHYEYPEKILDEAIVKKQQYMAVQAGGKNSYAMTLETQWDPLNGVSEFYGINAYEVDGAKHNLLASVENLSSCNKKVGELVHKLNLYEVPYLHFYDILEDFVNSESNSGQEEDASVV